MILDLRSPGQTCASTSDVRLPHDTKVEATLKHGDSVGAVFRQAPHSMSNEVSAESVAVSGGLRLDVKRQPHVLTIAGTSTHLSKIAVRPHLWQVATRAEALGSRSVVEIYLSVYGKTDKFRPI